MSISKDLDRRNIGSILLEMGAIDQTALQTALRLQKRRLGEILIDEQLVDPVSMASALKLQAQEVRSRAHTTIGVSASDLDETMGLLNAFESVLASQPRHFPVEGTKIWNDLRAQLENLLVCSLNPIVEQAQSYTKDIARRLLKKATLTADIVDVEIDRALRGEITEILLQLLRNAVFHGVESPERRIEKGKDPDAQIVLTSRYERGDLVFCVSDDGRGIDLEKVYEKATKAGVLRAPRDQVTDQEIIRCLFVPGFSTADKITEYAGFGIGLDLVEAAANRLGGSVDVTTIKDIGASFTVKIPLAFCRAPLIILRSGGLCLGVPVQQVSDVSSAKTTEEKINLFSNYFDTGVFGEEFNNKIYLNDVYGQCWAADFVSLPQKVLIRGLSASLKSEYGVLGSFISPVADDDASNQGILVDLGMLKENPREPAKPL